LRKAQGLVTNGVDWSVLWDYRRETFLPEHLSEGYCENAISSAAQ